MTERELLDVSDDQDRRCLMILARLREGRLAEVEQQLAEFEHMYHYAGAAPSWRGLHNLTHCFRALLTRYCQATIFHSQRGLHGLTAIEEASEYDPNQAGATPADEHPGAHDA